MLLWALAPKPDAFPAPATAAALVKCVKNSSSIFLADFQLCSRKAGSLGITYYFYLR